MLTWLFAGGKKMKSKACAAANYFETPVRWENLVMLGRTPAEGSRVMPHMVDGGKDTYEDEMEQVFGMGGTKIHSVVTWITPRDETNYANEL